MPPTITTETGAIAVPMSTILDALEGVLTDAEREALLGQIIGLRPVGVAPGDLIEAELFNQMMSDLNALTLRVAALEGAAGGPQIPIITSIAPNPATVGSDMKVIGEHLEARFLTSIEVGDSRIATALLKLGSSPTQLIFSTPGVSGATPAGVPVLVRVANDAGAATSSCVIRSGVAANLAAAIGAVITKAPAAALAKNTDYEFELDLTIESSHPETFNVTPLLAVNPATGWTIAVTDGAQASVPSTAGVPVTRKVVVKLHTGNSGGGSFSLQFTGTNFPTFQRSSISFPIAIGATTDETTGPIQIKSVAVTGDQTQKTFKNGEILITSKLLQTGSETTKTIRLTIELTIAPTGANALYDVSLALEPPPVSTAPHWDVALTFPPPATPQIAQPPAGAPVSITATIKASDASAPDSMLVVNVNGQGTLPKMTQKLGLRVVQGTAIP